MEQQCDTSYVSADLRRERAVTRTLEAASMSSWRPARPTRDWPTGFIARAHRGGPARMRRATVTAGSGGWTGTRELVAGLLGARREQVERRWCRAAPKRPSGPAR